MSRKPTDNDLRKELERLRSSSTDADEEETVPLTDQQRWNLADLCGIPFEETPEERATGTPDLPPLNAAGKSAEKGDGLTGEQRDALSSLASRSDPSGDGGDRQ